MENRLSTPLKPLLLSTALAAGLILAPENLVRLGNATGRGGFLFLVFFAIAAAIHVGHALSYGWVDRQFKGSGEESALIKQALGGMTAALFTVGTRVMFAVILTVAVLATSGFVFNEIYERVFFISSFLIDISEPPDCVRESLLKTYAYGLFSRQRKDNLFPPGKGPILWQQHRDLRWDPGANL